MTSNKKTIREETLVMNSSYRSFHKDSSTSFTYVFPETISNVTEMIMYNAEIPVDVFFTVSESYGNNVRYIDEVEIKIPDGNYTSPESFSEAINTAIGEKMSIFDLSDVEIDGFMAQVRDGDVVTAVSTAYYMYFYSPRGHTITFSTHDYDPNHSLSLGWLLGFRENPDASKPGWTIDSGGYVKGNAPVNLAPNKFFFVAIEDYNSNGVDSVKVMYGNHALNKRVIAFIPFVQTQSDSNKSFIYNKLGDTPTNRRKYTGPTDIKKITIELLDDFGRVVDLNQMDWSFVLSFTREI